MVSNFSNVSRLSTANAIADSANVTSINSTATGANADILIVTRHLYRCDYKKLILI